MESKKIKGKHLVEEFPGSRTESLSPKSVLSLVERRRKQVIRDREYVLNILRLIIDLKVVQV